MTKEALKLALEALEAHADIGMKSDKAITAIKEVLAQPEQRPVAFVKGCNRGQWEIFPAKAHQIFGIEQPLYATPPQRPWVGLTDEEITTLDMETSGTTHDFVDAIEAALRSKNT